MDDFVLNIAPSSSGGSSKKTQAAGAKQKGGRWTDRVKANKQARDGPPKPKVPKPPPSYQPMHRRNQPPAPTTTPAAGPKTTTTAKTSSSAPIASTSSSTAVRPNKKFRLDEDANEEYDEDTYEDRGASKHAAASTTKGGSSSTAPTKQVISSLFSYKDGARVTTLDDTLEPSNSTSLVPASNAVSTSTPRTTTDNTSFPGLGLDPLLVHHLAHKLSITHPTQIQRASLSSMLDPTFTQEQRDVFIQSQTGSGKTLTYLLPIIQDLLPLSSLSYIDRSIGTLAIILVPTRELAKQISDVLESLLSLHLSLRTNDDDNDDPSTASDQPVQQRRTRWIVPGLLTGGATRTHEKARIRKGLPILVSTPGRLLDHLQNTTSFDVGKLRWLVLDEADRLMDLGFEETVNGILKGLEGRRKLALESLRSGAVMPGGIGGWDWARERKTVLCSATVREDVQKLAGTALRRPVVFRATDVAALKDAPKLVAVGGGANAKATLSSSSPSTTTTTTPSTDAKKTQEGGTELADVLNEANEEKFTPPSQLAQKHIVVAPKLRLVTLVALLRSLLSKKNQSSAAGTAVGMKVIVFLSTTDSVDFHWKMLGGVGMGGEKVEEEGGSGSESEEDNEEAEEDAEDFEGGGDSDEEEIRAMIKAAKATEANPSSTAMDEDDDELTTTTADGKKKKKAKPKSAAQKAAQLIKDEPISFTSTLLPNTTIHRLHGSLPLQTRLASLKSFASTAVPPPSTDGSKPAPLPASSILFCTSVASRGLDLPTVRAVVQYDLPTEGGVTEYVHRVGRTARVGRGGEAWSFVGTGPEKDWVPWIEGKMGDGVKVVPVGVEGVLKKGFGGESVWEGRATEVQGAFERWVLSKTKHTNLAQKAYQSYVRSYSTHPLDEKRFFHLKNLHLGHVAKSFALRDAPSAMVSAGGGSKKKQAANAIRPAGSKWERDDDEGKMDAEKRMQEAVRQQGRLTKRAGVLGVVGAGDFQVGMSTNELEKMAGGFGKGSGGGGGPAGKGKRKRRN